MALGVVELMVLLLGGGTVLVVVLVAVALTGGSRAPVLVTSEVAAARRHAVTTSVLAATLSLGTPLVLVVGLGAVVLLGLADIHFVVPAMALAFAPLIGAAAGLLVLLGGELTWPRPTRPSP